MTDKRDTNNKKRSRYYEKLYGLPKSDYQERKAPSKRAKTEVPAEKPKTEKEEVQTSEPKHRRRLNLRGDTNPQTNIFNRMRGFLQPIPTPTESATGTEIQENADEEPQEEEIDLGVDPEVEDNI